MQEDRTLLNRTVLLSLFILLWFCIILLRLFQLQVIDHAELKEKAEQQQQGFVEVSPKRGDILDRNLDALASSVVVESIFSHPKDIEDPAQAAQGLAPILGLDPTILLKKLTGPAPFVYVKRKASPKEIEQVRKLGLRGIYFQKENKRIYPHKELAAHVLGFVGTDDEGFSGIEYFLDTEIKGTPGKIFIHKDARRNIFAGYDAAGTSEGNVVILNLDKDLQFVAEQELQRAVEFHRALSGAVVVIDPWTGEVVAMASYPTFNPNRYADFPVESRRNRAILEVYEPGSTFKIITASAAIAEKVVGPDEVIDCQIGTVALGGKVFGEAKHSFGFLSFPQIVEKSSNVGTIKLGLRLGEDRLYDYIRRFGFGSRTGIELPAEETGLLRRPSEWSKLSIGAISIGQEIGVTALQVVTAVSAVANGGHWVRPRILDRVLTPHGEVLRTSLPERKRVLSSQDARLMGEALRAVVERGTGQLALPEGYGAAGKTGTAQKFINGAYSDAKYVASFVGFAPAEHPALAAIVVINEPNGSIYGGSVAAPVFKSVMERSLLHLRVPKTHAAPRLLRTAKAETPTTVWQSEQEELLPIEKAVADFIEQQQWNVRPEPGGVSVSVAIQQDAVQVPDFTGKSLRQVLRECNELKLTLKATGLGVAVGQRPAPGSRAIAQTTCEVFFALGNR